MNDIVAEIVSRLDPDLREEWEERAAIMEYEGGVTPREYAEALALLCLLRNHPAALLPSYEKEK